MKCFLILGLAAGCGKSEDAPAAGETAIVVAQPVAQPVRNDSASSVISPCPHDGLWAECSVERRLRQSGFVARKIDSVTAKRSGFAVKPTVYSLGQARLEIFIYRNAASLNRDVSALDTVAVGLRGSAVNQWGEVRPTLIRSANLAAVLLSTNQRQVERLMLALTAGPPQPGSPR